MDKKLADIKVNIESRAYDFGIYLAKLLNDDTAKFLRDLAAHTDVFIFSGVIRNFFINASSFRDLDVVISNEVNLELILQEWEYKKNSFGGYKININGQIVDLWYINKTWGIQYQGLLNLDLEQFIPRTAFFNFSSIIYDLNHQKFIYTDHFAKFLMNRKLDIVFEPNANEPLCIINTLYYSHKYNLKISKRLVKYIKNLYAKKYTNLEDVQIKHFGEILYPHSKIEYFISQL